MGIFIVFVSIFVLTAAYILYGGWLAKKWGIDEKNKTPAHTMGDGVDYVPAKSGVVLGHHFASIAGAGPIVGPITAAIFGWVPVFLWIIVGGIFFGGVHDYGSIVASLRSKGKSVGVIIKENIGQKEKILFSLFSYLTLILVVAAFINIVADTFVSTPTAATTSMLFMGIAILFGVAQYRFGLPLIPGTVIGIILLFLSIWFGINNPLVLSKNTWMAILAIYIFIASITPVWILLEPRDYLNSFLLYAMLLGAIVGVFLYKPSINTPAFTGFYVDGKYIFPMLFIMIACGAISGFHSLVGSGTSAKMISSEADAKVVGYGGMLIESFLAVIALMTVVYMTGDKFRELMTAGGPVNVFATGVGEFMTKMKIPFETGKSFVALAISAFALTSLDTAARLCRFIFMEVADDAFPKGSSAGKLINNRITASLISVVLGVLLGSAGYLTVWPIFGSANQLLAAFSLLAIAAFLVKRKLSYKMTVFPMIFMFLATLTALSLLIKSTLESGNYPLFICAITLFLLAIVLIIRSYNHFKKAKAGESI